MYPLRGLNGPKKGQKKHHAKKDPNVFKNGKKRFAVISFKRFTFARPDTKEYQRFLNQPQHPTHIEEINKYLEMRRVLGTEKKYVSG